MSDTKKKGQPKQQKQQQPEPEVVPAVAPVPAPVVQQPPAVADTNNVNEVPQTNATKEGKKEKKDKKAPFQREQGRGIVKAVPSGDTLVVVSLAKGKQGPPEEREITLSNINAPRLGRRKTQKAAATKDEPFAWQSREFLRKKAIGRPVSYVIEYKTESKSYGVVVLVDQKGGPAENLAKSIVGEGWAKVRQPNQDQVRPDIAELLELQQSAQSAGKGVFSQDTQGAIRPSVEAEATELFEEFKGKPVSALVEQVLTGSRLRVVILPSFYNTTILLSGVESPDISMEGKAEKFGREAKFFSEHFLLHRDVQLILEGVDKFNLYGSVSQSGHNISEELLRNGLGRYVEWSGNRSAFAEKLKAAERVAKEKKLRIWSDYQPEVKSATSRAEEKGKPKVGREIIGKVSKIVSAGILNIIDQGDRPHEIYLSSIKIPYQGNFQIRENETREQAYQRTLGWEGKEYLRRRLIGQRVRVVCDYIKASFTREAAQHQKDKAQVVVPERPYYSVYIDKNNVAVELVDQGYAFAQDHRAGEPRSKDYEDILFAEQRAKKAGKGVHIRNLDKAAVLHINDLSVSKKDEKDVQKAKQFLPFLKRLGRTRGIVEYVYSGSRLKLYVPKENCQIVLILSGISAPRPPEDFADEALNLVNQKALQRDVEFEVLNQDKRGNFIGNVWISKEENLASQLLEAGLAIINYNTVKENPLQNQFITAEETAKKAKRNVWVDYDEAKEAEERQKQIADQAESVKPTQEFLDVVISEIVDATHFYVQIVGKESTELDDLMKRLAVESDNTPYTPSVGELVKAQFTADDAWYRARVLSQTAEGEYNVFYVDYGNTETVPTSRIRELKGPDAEIAPHAKRARLAYVAPPKLDDDYGHEAAEFLRDLVWGKTMMANVEYRENAKRENEVLHLSLGDRESQVHVNAALVRAGLARVEKIRTRHLQPMIEKLREEEQKARQSHAYIWEYGDPGSDEEEESAFSAKKRGKK